MFFYKRIIEVLTSGLKIKELKIEIDIKKDTKESPSTGTVAIWNLSKTNETLIHDTAKTIVVSAGYEDFSGVIFNGTVQEVERDRTDLGRVAKISVSAGNEVNFLSGVTSRSFVNIPLVDIIIILVTFDLEPIGTYILGDTSVIPEETIHTYSYTGTTKGALTRLLRPRGVTWYNDDGVIKFSKKGIPQVGSEAILVSPKTGLIGSPTVTSNRTNAPLSLRIRTFLNPRFQMGGIISLESRDFKNNFKIVSLLYKGTNWEGGFYTECEIEQIN